MALDPRFFLAQQALNAPSVSMYNPRAGFPQGPPPPQPGSYEEIVARAKAGLAAQQPQQQSQGGFWGSGFGQVLGKALKPLEWASVGGRAVTSAGFEVRDLLRENGLGGLLDAASPWLNDEKGDGGEASFDDFLRQLRDPTFGYGDRVDFAQGRDGNAVSRAADRVYGFLGDVALDPLTYVTAGGAKAAQAAGRGGREALAVDALTALRTAGVDEATVEAIVSKAGRSGIHSLTAAERALIGTERAGMRFAGQRIPGTERIAQALNATPMRARVALGDRAPVFRSPLMLKEEIAKEQLRLASGKGPMSATQAAASISAKTVGRGWGTEARSQIAPLSEDFLRQARGVDSPTLVHALETGTLDEVGQAGRDLFDRSIDAVNDSLKELGEKPELMLKVRPNYVPHLLTDEGRELLAGNPQLARQIGVEVQDGGLASTQFERRLQAGTKVTLPDGSTAVLDGTIKNANEVFGAAYGIKLYDDDINRLVSHNMRQVDLAVRNTAARRRLAELGVGGDFTSDAGRQLGDNADGMTRTVVDKGRRKELLAKSDRVDKRLGKAIDAKAADGRKIAASGRAKTLPHVREAVERYKDLGADARSRASALADDLRRGNTPLGAQAKKIQKEIDVLQRDIDAVSKKLGGDKAARTKAVAQRQKAIESWQRALDEVDKFRKVAEEAINNPAALIPPGMTANADRLAERASRTADVAVGKQKQFDRAADGVKKMKNPEPLARASAWAEKALGEAVDAEGVAGKAADRAKMAADRASSAKQTAIGRRISDLGDRTARAGQARGKVDDAQSRVLDAQADVSRREVARKRATFQKDRKAALLKDLKDATPAERVEIQSRVDALRDTAKDHATSAKQARALIRRVKDKKVFVGREGEQIVEDLEQMLLVGANGKPAQGFGDEMRKVIADYTSNLQDFERLVSQRANLRDFRKSIKDADTRLVWTSRLKEGWAELGEGTGFAVPEAVADAFKRVKLLEDPATWGKFGKMVDWYTNFFRTYATASPGFHVRNAYSAVTMNFIGGVSFENMRKGAHYWHLYVKDHKNWLNQIPEAERGAARRALEAVFASGAGQFDEVTLSGGSRIINNKVTRTSRQVGRRTEATIRMGMALDSTLAGESLDAAVARVERYHFNYTEMSKFDRTMRRIVPFWTFASRNLPLQMQLQYSQPRVYAAYANFVKNFRQDEEGDVMPQAWREQGAFGFLRRNDGGEGSWFMAPDLPWTRIDQEMGRFSDPQRLLADVNPLFRVPFETMVADKRLYNDVPFKEDGLVADSWLQKADVFNLLGALGIEETAGDGTRVIPERLAYAAMNMIPTLGQLERLAPTDDFYKGRLGQSWASYFGLPLRQLSQGSIDAEKRRQEFDQEAMLRRLEAIANFQK